MLRIKLLCAFLTVFLVARPATAQETAAAGSDQEIVVELFDPGYLEGDANYHSLTAASDGDLYFTINTHHPRSSARLYRFDPREESIALAGDVNAVLGEDVHEQLPHGKVHTPLFEYDGALYFTTHTSQYEGSLPQTTPKDGRRPYHGGHFMRYDLETAEFEELAHLGLPNEGLITAGLDTTNGMFYGLTWPSGLLTAYNLQSGLLQHWGAVQQRGEWGHLPDEWNFICRELALNPSGQVFCSTNTGRIWRVDPTEQRAVRYLDVDLDAVPPVQEEDFDIKAEPHYFWRNWRTIVWNPSTGSFWGLHGGSTQLFEFDPSEGKLRSVRPMRVPGAGKGRRNAFRTQLGFMLGPDNTLYYLAHGPQIHIEGRRDVGSSVHLLTYDIDNDHFTDHGALIGPDDRRVFFAESIEIGPDNRLYTVAWVETTDPERMRLVQDARGGALPDETKDAIYEIQLVRLPPRATLNARR